MNKPKSFRKIDEREAMSQVSDIIRLSRVSIEVPYKIEQILTGIDTEYSDVEFSICCKTTFNKTTERYEINPDDIFIPKQEVSSYEIVYKEDNMDYNTVIHKHPSGCRSFSSVDDQYINGNFKFSLLWVDNKIEFGIGNFRIEPGVFVEVKLNIISGRIKDVIIPEGVKEKIKRSSPRNVLIDRDIPSSMDFHIGPYPNYFNVQENEK
jgi:hypothetical protein